MGQSVHPVTVRYGSSQLWNFSWLGNEHLVHYPYMIKLFRFFSKFVQTFFLYQLYIRTSIFFFSDIFNWRNSFIKHYFQKSYSSSCNNKLKIFYFFTKSAAIKQLRYKKSRINKVFVKRVNYFKKTFSTGNSEKILDITRSTRLLRAVSTMQRYLIPLYFYQARYSTLLSSALGKIRKLKSFQFKKVNKRFLFSKNNTIISGSVHMFRYKTWVLFLWHYLLTNLQLKKSSKGLSSSKSALYLNRHNLEATRGILNNYSTARNSTKKLKIFLRNNEMLTFNTTSCFLF